MNFADALKTHLAGSDTGQLVVKFSGVPHLCKISIEQGLAVYIALGTMDPGETLDFITDKTPLQANFIPGVPPRRRLPEPLNDTLLAIAGSTMAYVSTEIAGSESEGVVPAARIESAIVDFVDLVGPLGQVLAERALSRLGYQNGQDMAGSSYTSFIGALQQEVPEEDRRAFVSRHLK